MYKVANCFFLVFGTGFASGPDLSYTAAVGDRLDIACVGQESGRSLRKIIDVTFLGNHPEITEIYWKKDGVALNLSNTDKFSGGTLSAPGLTVKSVELNDKGHYSCHCKNNYFNGPNIELNINTGKDEDSHNGEIIGGVLGTCGGVCIFCSIGYYIKRQMEDKNKSSGKS